MAKKEEGKKKAQAREKQERLEARREVCTFCSTFGFQNWISHVCDIATAYARGAGRPERSGSRRGIRWLRAEYVLPHYPYSSAAHSGGYLRCVTATESGDEWKGIASPSKAGGGPEHAAEYSDEEQLATVTVVEDFDPSTLIHGITPERPEPPPARLPLLGKVSREDGEMGYVQRRASKRKSIPAKKVRYETKAARKATQAKQRERRTEKAERAGGKAARKRAGGKKRR